MGSPRDLIGQKFGRLTVIEQREERIQGGLVWLCLCDCKKVVIVRSVNLCSGGTKSCGCLVKDASSKQSKLRIKPKGYASMTGLYNNYKQNALRKQNCFNLSRPEFERLVNQECFYCGSPPNQIITGNKYNGSCVHNGIDRVDNSKGYAIDNCVPCCKHCNYAKGSRTQKEFFEWINEAYNHNIELIEEIAGEKTYLSWS